MTTATRWQPVECAHEDDDGHECVVETDRAEVEYQLTSSNEWFCTRGFEHNGDEA